MRYLKEWPRLLLTLPNTIRLGLLTLCTILGLGIHILTFPESHNGSLLLIPVCLAAWMFKKRGLFACITVEIAVMVVYQIIRLKSVWWPLSFAVFFWGGFLVLLLIGLIIISVRTLVDSSETARQRAEQAEQQIAIAYDQQVQINELKDQFLLNVNHELCTPLTVLGSSLEVLKEHYEHLDPIKRANVLTRATENHEELVRLVNRVLDAVTVTGEFPPAQCKVVFVHQMVQEILAHIDPQGAQAYTFHLQIPEQATVWADPQYLHQVLRNLLSNVFKYVPKQTEIRIETAQPTPSSPVCLIVQDTGPGIPPEELPHLFEKFVRLKRDVAGAKRGTGLGLYICKQLVEAMGGQIWVESSGRMGEGCRFCLTLPPHPPHSLP
jgi:signal transduction histidine kinase